MSLPDAVLERITRLLSTYAGTPVSIVQSESATSGWSALRARWPHLPSAQPFYPAFQSRTS